MLHDALDQDKGRANINAHSIVKFLKGNVPDIGESLSVPRVGDQDIRSLTMLGVDLLEHSFDLLGGADIYLVD